MTELIQEVVEENYIDTLRYVSDNADEIRRRYEENIAVRFKDGVIEIIDSDSDMPELLNRAKDGKVEEFVAYTTVNKAIGHLRSLGEI